MVTPIFLFSLPRSGSTMVQRVLGAHADIATVSEPWVLLPFIYTMREGGAYAEYVHHGAVKAIRDFYGEFPNGRQDYLDEIRHLVLNLYMKTAVYHNQRYFLDKTPRYHLIANEIIELFPDAKFVFLWRNPLAIAASIIESWGGGKWILYRFNVDLYQGFRNLVAAYETHSEKAISIQYEDLVSGSEESWENLFTYLELTYHSDYLNSFNKTILRGRYGDKLGSATFSEIDQTPLNKWATSFMNPLRRAWGMKYLQEVGGDVLKSAGYNLHELLGALRKCSQSSSHLIEDMIRMGYGSIYQKFEPQILKKVAQKEQGFSDL